MYLWTRIRVYMIRWKNYLNREILLMKSYQDWTPISSVKDPIHLINKYSKHKSIDNIALAWI